MDLATFLKIEAGDENPRVRIVGELGTDFGFEKDLLILVGGALTTPERFACFHESLAHICLDGKIKRFNRVIGDVSNLELV
jgi:hypothetical protein